MLCLAFFHNVVAGVRCLPHTMRVLYSSHKGGTRRHTPREATSTDTQRDKNALTPTWDSTCNSPLARRLLCSDTPPLCSIQQAQRAYATKNICKPIQFLCDVYVHAVTAGDATDTTAYFYGPPSPTWTLNVHLLRPHLDTQPDGVLAACCRIEPAPSLSNQPQSLGKNRVRHRI